MAVSCHRGRGSMRWCMGTSETSGSRFGVRFAAWAIVGRNLGGMAGSSRCAYVREHCICVTLGTPLADRTNAHCYCDCKWILLFPRDDKFSDAEDEAAWKGFLQGPFLREDKLKPGFWLRLRGD